MWVALPGQGYSSCQSCGMYAQSYQCMWHTKPVCAHYVHTKPVCALFMWHTKPVCAHFLCGILNLSVFTFYVAY